MRYLLIPFLLALIISACTGDNGGEPTCDVIGYVSWNTGGYAPHSGWIEFCEFEYLPSGGVRGLDEFGNEFYVHSGKAVIRVRTTSP